MRMFLVGMCDIFLILYLTTMSQVSQFPKSNITVDDYHKAQELKDKAILDAEQAKEAEKIAKEAEEAAKAREEAAKEAERLAREAERVAKENEKQAIVKAELLKANEIKAIEAVNDQEKIVVSLEAAKKQALQLAMEAQKAIAAASKREVMALQSATEAEQKALAAQQKTIDAKQNAINSKKIAADAEQKALEEKNKASIALLEKEIAKKESEKLLLRAQNAETVAASLKEKEELARLQIKESVHLIKVAKVKEEDALKLVEEARKKAEEERKRAEEAQKKAEEAIKLAKDARAQAANFREEAWEAQRERRLAINEAKEARTSEANAQQLVLLTKKEVEFANSKVEAISQSTDTAFKENIRDKVVQYTIMLQYKNRLKIVSKKTIELQAVPIKVNNEYLIFAPLEQIGFGKLFPSEKFLSYDIAVNNSPVSKIYVSNDGFKVAALVVNYDVSHTKFVDIDDNFSSFMPVLISLRNNQVLGVIDRIRGVNIDYFTFNRDYLRLISKKELHFEDAGFRGTGSYAEYLVEGDQIVDLDGNFIGLAYKKNSVVVITGIEGWHEIYLKDYNASMLALYIDKLTD